MLPLSASVIYLTGVAGRQVRLDWATLTQHDLARDAFVFAECRVYGLNLSVNDIVRIAGNKSLFKIKEFLLMTDEVEEKQVYANHTANDSCVSAADVKCTSCLSDHSPDAQSRSRWCRSTP